MDMERVIQEAYDNGYLRGYEKGKADRHKGEWRNLDGEPVPLDEGGCPTESAWCSECGTWLVASDEYSVIGRFCPNCGARMKGADDE